MRKITIMVILLSLAASFAEAHTWEERRDDLETELAKHFDPVWIENIFNHQNLCADQEVAQETLSTWGALEQAMLSEDSVRRGVKFFREHRQDFQSAESRFGQSEALSYDVLAILRIESDLGENRAGVPVVRALLDIYHRIKDGPAGDSARKEMLRNSIIPFFRAAEENDWNVCQILGSRAAAFGYPHFIPSSLKYAADGDGDGRIDLVRSLRDAIHSIANLLMLNGWDQSRTASIYWYNPMKKYRKDKSSYPYVRMVRRYADTVQHRYHHESSPTPVTER